GQRRNGEDAGWRGNQDGMVVAPRPAPPWSRRCGRGASSGEWSPRCWTQGHIADLRRELIGLTWKRRIVRVLPVAVAGSLALVGVSAGSASGTVSTTGACVQARTGTGTILMYQSYINHMLSHRISITAWGTTSTERTNHYDKNSTNNRYTITNYATTGGDANLSATAGRVQFSGGIQILNVVTGRKLIFGDIAYDATNHQVDYTLFDATVEPNGVPVGGIPIGFVVPIFQMGAPEQVTADGSTVSYSSSQELLTPPAADAMNAYFGTNVFQPWDNFGPGFRTTYTTDACA